MLKLLVFIFMFVAVSAVAAPKIYYKVNFNITNASKVCNFAFGGEKVTTTFSKFGNIPSEINLNETKTVTVYLTANHFSTQSRSLIAAFYYTCANENNGRSVTFIMDLKTPGYFHFYNDFSRSLYSIKANIVNYKPIPSEDLTTINVNITVNPSKD